MGIVLWDDMKPHIHYRHVTSPEVVKKFMDQELPPTGQLGKLGLWRYSLAAGPETTPDNGLAGVYAAVAGDSEARDYYRLIHEHLAGQYPETMAMVGQAAALYDALPDWMAQVRADAVKDVRYGSTWGTATSQAKLDYTTWSAALLAPAERAKWLESLALSAGVSREGDIALAAGLDDGAVRSRLLRQMTAPEKLGLFEADKALERLATDDPSEASRRAAETIRRDLEKGVAFALSYDMLIDIVLPGERDDLHMLAASKLEDTFPELDARSVKYLMSHLPDELRGPLEERLQTWIVKRMKEWPSMPEYSRSDIVELLGYVPSASKGPILEWILSNASPHDHSTFLAVLEICCADPADAVELMQGIMSGAGQDEAWLPHGHNVMRTIHNLPPDELGEMANWILDEAPLGMSSLGVVDLLHVLPEGVKDGLYAKARRHIRTALHKSRLDSNEFDEIYWPLSEIGMDETDGAEMSRKLSLILHQQLNVSKISEYGIRQVVRRADILSEQDQSELYERAIIRIFEVFEQGGYGSRPSELFQALDDIPREHSLPILKRLDRPAIEGLSRMADISSGDGRTRNVKPHPDDIGEVYGNDSEKLVRVVPMTGFDAWLRAYLDDEAWRDMGYVPIEPICAVVRADNETMNVAVQTVKLRGGSLVNTLFQYEPAIIAQIVETVDVIRERLDWVVGVSHGHDDQGNNFVLVPQVVGGVPDPSNVPRVYMIDFDMAMAHAVKDACGITPEKQARHTVGPSGA